MAEGTNGSRSWQEIAKEASTEQNPHRLVKLAEELNKVLEQQRATTEPDTAKKGKSA